MIIKDLDVLIGFFPIVKAPIILSIDEAIIYSRENKPLPQSILDNVFVHFEKENLEEDTVEYIPCFRLEGTGSIHAIVYYRSDITLNEYHLLTISEKGKVIDKKAIAGSFFNDREIIKSVASIDEDGLIQVVIGSDDINDNFYNPLNSKIIAYEIAPDGKIIMATNINNDEQ